MKLEDKMNTEKFEAIVLVYGVPDERTGQIITEQAAMQVFDKLRQQADQQAQVAGVQGYHIVDTRIEGDREQGKVYATFESPASLRARKEA
jgi:hypothetical protein